MGHAVTVDGFHQEIPVRPHGDWRAGALAVLHDWGLRCLDLEDTGSKAEASLALDRTFVNWLEAERPSLEKYCAEADPRDCARHRAAGRCIRPAAFIQEELPW